MATSARTIVSHALYAALAAGMFCGSSGCDWNGNGDTVTVKVQEEPPKKPRLKDRVHVYVDGKPAYRDDDTIDLKINIRTEGTSVDTRVDQVEKHEVRRRVIPTPPPSSHGYHVQPSAPPPTAPAPVTEMIISGITVYAPGCDTGRRIDLSQYMLYRPNASFSPAVLGRVVKNDRGGVNYANLVETPPGSGRLEARELPFQKPASVTLYTTGSIFVQEGRAGSRGSTIYSPVLVGVDRHNPAALSIAAEVSRFAQPVPAPYGK